MKGKSEEQVLKEKKGIAERLKTLRMMSGKSMRDFALDVGLTVARVSGLETGTVVVDDEVVDSYAKACSASRRWIVTGEGGCDSFRETVNDLGHVAELLGMFLDVALGDRAAVVAVLDERGETVIRLVSVGEDVSVDVPGGFLRGIVIPDAEDDGGDDVADDVAEDDDGPHPDFDPDADLDPEWARSEPSPETTRE